MRCLQLLAFSTLLFGALNAAPLKDILDIFLPSKWENKRIFKDFLGNLLATKDKKRSINSFFRDDFFYNGCYGNYDKKGAIAYLLGWEDGFDIDVDGSKELGGNRIRYELTLTKKISFWTKKTISFELVLNIKNSKKPQLVSGATTWCPRNLLGSVAGDGSEVIVLDLIGKVETFINNGKSADLAILFAEDFTFRGCEGNYGKEKAVEVLSLASRSIKFHVASSKFIGKNQIEFKLDVKGFPVTCSLYFNGSTWLLSYAGLDQC
uniref:NTF2-like domain-containing protein n=1 Tax=Caenorhabditis japonica TaxID=281687 RepID=A0A8R1I6P3_CAEJA